MIIPWPKRSTSDDWLMFLRFSRSRKQNEDRWLLILLAASCGRKLILPAADLDDFRWEPGPQELEGTLFILEPMTPDEFD